MRPGPADPTDMTATRSSLGPTSSKTIYSRRRLQSLFGVFGLLALALAAYSHGSNGLAIGLAAFGAVAAAYLLRRPRLHVGPWGVTVVNLARTYRVPWSEIAGFGFGSGGMVPCLSIRRRDGSTINALVVTDDVRSGYSPRRVREIVADLQDRLAAANGTPVDRELDHASRPDVEPRARRVSRRVQQATWFLLCLFLVAFGIATAWNAASDLPHTYSRLSSQGVRATAIFVGCRVTGIGDDECRLSLTYQGHTRVWSYSEDFPQFDHLPVGAPVDVLVDPKHPTTVYTVHDVAARYNAGFGGLEIAGIAMAVVGVLGFGWSFWSKRRLEAKIRQIIVP